MVPQKDVEELRQPLEAVGAGSMKTTMDRAEKSGEEQGLGHFFYHLAAHIC